MKTKIIIGLVVLSLCFVFGGFYITEAMNQVVDKLQDMMVLQEMGFQRENLLAQIKALQSDLLLKDSPHETDFNTFVEHGEAMNNSIEACHFCHHPESLAQSMQELRNQTESYLKRVSTVYMIRANPTRMNESRNVAFREGKLLFDEVDSLFASAAHKIAARTAQARQSVAGTRVLLISFVIIGPLIILLGAAFFLVRFTFSVTALAKGIGKVKEGNLEYRITEDLTDEFRDLAEAFNDMGASLKEQRRRIEIIQRRYRILFESAGDAIFILEAGGDNAGKIVSANKAAADMHGYSIEELLTMHIRDLDVAGEAAKIPERIARMLDGVWIKDVINHRRKDGTVFPVEISAGFMEFDGHKYILAFDRDITERVQTEEALQRSKQLAMVGQMAAGLVHEIKNPLAGIKVSMEVLSSELEMEQEDREVMLRVVNEVNRIESLLRNVLEYARPPKPEFSSCDIKRLLENSVKNAELSLKSPANAKQKEKNIVFVREMDDWLPTVMADSAKLLQVFLNLLLNAIEASPEGGVITVGASQVASSADALQIVIADTGKGLDPDTLAKIFQPFYTTKPRGSGLGLAISKRLIEQHQGTIAVDSISGQGTTFIIRLPLEQNNGEDEI
jgi:two-component system sensor histidine kinase AtoS